MDSGSSNLFVEVNDGSHAPLDSLVDTIHQGTYSIVYRATCKRGRLHGRVLALKKVNLRDCEDALPQLPSYSGLHHSLHHPSIVSLHTFFSTSSAHYQVLEYCPRGTLRDIIRSRWPQFLVEDEIRAILKTLTSALVYLSRELVVHRTIKPENVLVSEDSRVKLSGFEFACRLPSVHATLDTFPIPSGYVAPELAARIPHSFPVDVWSLGVVAIECLSGGALRSDQADSPSIMHDFPQTISDDLVSLLRALTEKDPSHRPRVCDILSLPFLDRSLPILPLRDLVRPLQRSTIMRDSHTAFPATSKPRHPKSLSDPQRSAFPRMSSTPSLMVQERILHDQDLKVPEARARFKSYLKSQAPTTAMLPGRRIFSAPSMYNAAQPTPSRPSGDIRSAVTTPCLTDDSEVSSDCGFDVSSQVSTKGYLLNHPLLNLPKTKPAQLSAFRTDNPLDTYDTAPPHAKPSHGHQEHLATAPVAPSASSPRLTTTYLTPQTHKVSKGQLTILPSMSLLIDFREGQRRNGHKGVEVLCISPDGLEVAIYSAPHLSSPCCLAEPSATYQLRNLPHSYRKQYEEAARIVDQLKRRIPKMILYRPEGKYTLMANEPGGDIEIVSPPPVRSREQDGKNKETSAPATSNQTRVRYLRSSKTVEISHFKPSKIQTTPVTGEWTRKVLRITNVSDTEIRVIDEDTTTLDSGDWDELCLINDFLPVCRAIGWIRSNGPDQRCDQLDALTTLSPVTRDEGLRSPSSDLGISSRARAASFSSLAVTVGADSRQSRLVATSTSAAPLNIVSNETSSESRRFLPSVGWCSRSLNEYQVLFLDGISLAVNVEDGSVVLTDTDGMVSKCSDGAWGNIPVIKERMKVFGKVVELLL